MIETIKFRLNHRAVELTTDGDRKLLWALRTDLSLTGTKYGCAKGICGACTILINQKAYRSCQVLINEAKGKEVITIEGLAKDGKLHPLQQAFIVRPHRCSSFFS